MRAMIDDRFIHNMDERLSYRNQYLTHIYDGSNMSFFSTIILKKINLAFRV